MRVHLLYFAALRDIVGKDQEEVSLPGDVRTVGDLRRWIATATPALAARLGSVRFAIDEAFEDDAAALHEGATVALIPPVAGG